MALFLAPTDVAAGYCDNDNDAPDSDDSSNAQCAPPNPEKNLGGGSASCPDSNAQQCKVGQFSGNPINNSNGNKFQEEADYASFGIFPLNITRYYNSQSSIADGPFGANWSHSYNAKIKKLSDVQAKVIRADEKTFTFNLINGVWTTDADVNGKLEQTFNAADTFTGWRYTTGDDKTETYGAGGRLLLIANRAGLEQTLSYDAQGNLVTVTDPFGVSLSFTYYEGQKRISSITNPEGKVYVYTYDANNNLASMTNTGFGNYKRQYRYTNINWPHALTALIDERNIIFANWDYNADGWAVSSSHVGDVEKVSLTYDKTNMFTDVENALGDHRRYTFRTFLGVSHTAHDAPVPTTGYTLDPINEMTYDSQGNLKTFKDINNNTTSYTYDLGRNLEISRTESSIRTISTEWHADFRLPAKITETGRVTDFSYDSHGNITQLQLSDTTVNNGALRYWLYTYTYDANILGLVIKKAVRGPNYYDLTTTDYYPSDAVCVGGHFGCRGQVKSITNPLGHVTRFDSYNVHGQPNKLTDANGVSTTLTYNTRLQLNAFNKGGETSKWTYNAIGFLASSTRPDGSQIIYSYDDAHRLTGIKDSAGNQVKYTFDLMGNKLQEDVLDSTGQVVQTHQYSYFSNGRLKTDTGAEGQITTYGYDDQGWGNLRSIQDTNNLTTQYQYDGLNRLIKTTDPLGSVVTQSFDVRDKPLSVTDPDNRKTSYTYDGLNNLTTETSPDRGVIKYNSYDAKGNLLKMTDANGNQIEYTYHLDDRLLGAQANTYSNQYFSYNEGVNGIGRLTSMSNENDRTVFSYDAQGRPLSKSQTITVNDASLTHTVNYSYDAYGRIATLTYPSGLVIGYGYDSAGRINNLTANGQPLINNIAYQPFGAPKSWAWGNGGVYARSFDADGRLTDYPLGAGGSRHLSYDAAGRITAYLTGNAETSRGFGYDDANRLNSYQAGSSLSKAYSYDDNGNRTGVDVNSSHYTYTTSASSNLLLSVAGPSAKTYNYDASGNPLSDGINSFTWNPRGRLSYAATGGNSHAYYYNGFGQRVAKTSTALTNTPYRFIYDESGHLLGEYNKDNAVRQETVWLGDLPVAVVKKLAGAFVTYYVQADHLNTARVILNSSNTVIWRSDNTTDPFGVSLPNEDGDGDGVKLEYNPRFPGQYYDKETGLHYNGFRDYDPNTGRYIEADPIGLAGGVNTYTYVGNNPLRYVDPLGLEATVIATPLPTGGFSFTATGTGLDGSINGTFNTGTTNFNQIQEGAYSVTPRPALPDTLINSLLNRNQYAGRPTISNTSDWNTIRYPDGSVTKGAQIHPGRNGTNQGTSLACMVTDQPTYNSLNKLFQDNYNNGGVKLIVNPAPAQ